MKKKRLLHLIVLLLMVVMGANADGLPITSVTSNDIGKVITTDGNIYNTKDEAESDGKTAVAMIAFVDAQNNTGLAIGLEDVSYYGNDMVSWNDAENAIATWATDKAVSGCTWKLPSIQEWQQMLIGCGAEGTVSDYPSGGTLSFIPINEKLATAYQYSVLGSYYWSSTESDSEYAREIGFSNYEGNTYAQFYTYVKTGTDNVRACLTFNIGGGSDPAEMTEGLRITTADIGKVVATDGKVYETASDVPSGESAVAMIAYVGSNSGLAIGLEDVSYYGNDMVSWNDAENAIATWATDKAVDGCTWKVPSIQEWQQMLIGCGSEGEVSDEPQSETYSITGINEKLYAASANKLRGYYWTSTDAYDSSYAREIYFGYDDDVTYVNFYSYTKTEADFVRACLAFNIGSGSDPVPTSEGLVVTTDDIGKVITTDGNIYDTKDEAESDGKTPAGMIVSVDMEHETGIAIAFEDEYNQEGEYNIYNLDWTTAKAKAAAHTPVIEGTTWKLPTQEEWQQMLEYTGGYSNSQLNNWLYNAGANTLSTGYYNYQEQFYPEEYWTSTLEDGVVWYAEFSNDIVNFYGTSSEYVDYYQKRARACFTFNVAVTKYPITVNSSYASYVQLNKTEAAEGEDVGVTITNIPEGQYVAYVEIAKADDPSNVYWGAQRSIYDENVWTFTMPAYPVIINWVYIQDIQAAEEIGGIYYILNNMTGTAKVAPHPSNGYSGAITIPATVYHNYRTYNVTTIGREAFAYYGNGEITDLTLNEGLTTIEQYAFRESDMAIVIPSSVNNISRWAFKGYKGTQMSVNIGNSTYDSRNNCNAIIETESSTIVAGCVNTAIPNNITTIGEAAFDGVGLTSITIPSNITTLDVGAFANNPLTAVTIPATVTTIYNNPFYGCNQLESIVVADGNPNYDSRNNCNAICDKEKRWVLSTCKNTVIPTSITGIGTHAFAYRDNLNEYKVPAHINLINDNAFAYSNLYNVSVADNDNLTIGQWAFGQCKELRTVKIGRGIRDIDQNVFIGCPNLSHIYVNAALVPKVKNYTFVIDDAGNTTTAKVHVPAASLKTYQKANFWKDLTLVAADGLQGVKAAFKQKKYDSTPSGAKRRTAGTSTDLITEEGTVWQGTYDGSDPFTFTTYSNEACIQIDGAPVSFANRTDEGFVISGSIKQIVVRAAGSVSNITCEIVDVSENADNTTADQTKSIAATTTSTFKNYTLSFSGTEYAKAKVKVTINGSASVYLSGISIIQGGGDYVIAEADQYTVSGIEYSNTLSAPASADDAEAIIDGTPVYVYTTCLPTAPEQSTGLKFYTLKGSTDNSLQFTEITGAPQANTPYLVAVSSTTEIDMSIGESVSVTLKKETDNTEDIGAYKFVGTTTGLTNAEAAAAGAYILQEGNVWGRVTTEHFEAYIPPFRAYIVPVASNARALIKGDFVSIPDDIRNISTMQLTDRDGTTHYFDLNGRRIIKPTAKGVYIVNGKKVIIK